MISVLSFYQKQNEQYYVSCEAKHIKESSENTVQQAKCWSSEEQQKHLKLIHN